MSHIAVTAKVKLNVKSEHGEGDDRYAVLSFAPDYQDGRNAAWALATPHLHLEMTVRGDVGDLFQAGKSYTLTFDEE